MLHDLRMTAMRKPQRGVGAVGERQVWAALVNQTAGTIRTRAAPRWLFRAHSLPNLCAAAEVGFRCQLPTPYLPVLASYCLEASCRERVAFWRKIDTRTAHSLAF